MGSIAFNLFTFDYPDPFSMLIVGDELKHVAFD